MSARQLNRKLVLEEKRTTPDTMGGFSEAWVALGTLWADVVPGTGREMVGEFVSQATVPCRITVRAAPMGAPSRPRAGQRFREGARLFRVLAVSERDRAGHYLTCIAQEEVVL